MLNRINKMNFNPSTLPIITLMNSIRNEKRNGLDLQPIYQRGYIWDNDFKEKLIYSLTKHYPIGNIIIRNLEEPNEKNAKSEVVDGQQRLTTIYKFMTGELVVSGEIAKKIVEENIDYYEEEAEINKVVARVLKKFKENKKLELSFSDFPSGLKSDIETFPLSLTFISNASTEQVSEYFRFVQNQERLKAGEIIESFPDTYLEKYLNMLESKENLLAVINFKDNRKEFEKIFYSMLGILENKLKLGCTDKSIQEYVNNKKGDLEGKEKEQVEKMIANLNIISLLSLKNIEINSNKRYLKLLLLLCSLGNLDFKKNGKEILLKLNLINEKLSAFNSAKANILKETFLEEEESKIEDYRRLSLLMKGSQKLMTVKERIIFLEKELMERGVKYGIK
jgi:uncharacterized protein with ParB-like and HNH nuclease domain